MYAVIYRLFIFNYNMFYARQFNAAVTAVLPYLIIYNYIYLHQSFQTPYLVVFHHPYWQTGSI